MKAIRYEITGPNALGDYRLISVVSTSWGGDATNFVCCGSWEDCERIRKKFEGRK